MYIKIYQINKSRDDENVKFESIDLLKHRLGENFKPDKDIYDMVFSGSVNCKTLDDVYEMFNVGHPEGFAGHSLSVSDIVEVIDGNISALYYCDSIGFVKIEFAESKKTMRVVICEPGKMARVADIGTELEDLQEIVDGYIEAVYPFDDTVCIVCNEEGKFNGSQLNRALYAEPIEREMSYDEMTSLFYKKESEKSGEHLTGYITFTEDSFSKPFSVESRTYEVSSDNKAFKPDMNGYSIYGSSVDGSDIGVRLESYMKNEKGGPNGWKIERCYIKEPSNEVIEIIAGTFFICDCAGENFASLSQAKLNKYKNLFKYPEYFLQTGNKIKAAKYQPEK